MWYTRIGLQNFLNELIEGLISFNIFETGKGLGDNMDYYRWYDNTISEEDWYNI